MHDHRLEIDERCFLPNVIMKDIKHYVMDNPEIRPSEIIRRIESRHNKKLKHLDILNALKAIKGDVKLDKEVLINDLEAAKTRYHDSFIDVNYGTPIIVFIQTKDMLDTYALYS